MDARAAYVAHVAEARPICSACREPKDPQQMAERSPQLCKGCVTTKVAAWKAENPLRFEEAARRSHLRKKYGITPEEYDSIVASQGGRCAIFSGALVGDRRGFRPHIDHCHETGRVRGVLCGSCNKGIGLLKDDPAVLAAAFEYLLRHKPLAEVS